jgi:imidazolonepropionase-like amidohydrolase
VLLVKAGLTPMEALLSATRNAAEFLGRLRTEGTIERGKLANLVVLDANPLTDISNTRRISAVVRSGQLIRVH